MRAFVIIARFCDNIKTEKERENKNRGKQNGKSKNE